MDSFKEWLNQERNNRLVAFRRWMWNRQHNGKNVDPPVTESDPDYEWIKIRADRLGPLDPHQHWEP
jgi:hypothetical protein